MELKAGYKQTEVGVIPEDWQILAIGDLVKKNKATILTGPFGTLLKANEYSNEGVPIISVGEIGKGTLNIKDTTPRAPPKVTKRLPQYLLKKGDIVFARKGAVDRSGIIETYQDGWFLGSDGIRLRLTSKVHPRFISFQLQGDNVHKWLNNTAIGTTMSSLNQEILSQLQLSVPPLPEQHAIATALSDADALITLMDQLIAKKRDLKKAAMQELLTGKQRLPGFEKNLGYKQTEVGVMPEDWEVNQISHFWETIDCKHITAEFVNVGIPVASIQEVQGCFVNLSEAKQTNRKYYQHLIEGRRKPFPGDLILSRNATVGAIAQVTEWHPPFAMGQDVCLLRKKSSNYSTSYLQSLFYSYIIASQIEKLMVGSTFKRINVEQIRNFFIPFPPLPEQTAIATVLSEMDTEITALGQQREKTKALKQGMMQELLTGRIRLV